MVNFQQEPKLQFQHHLLKSWSLLLNTFEVAFIQAEWKRKLKILSCTSRQMLLKKFVYTNLQDRNPCNVSVESASLQ